MNESLILRNKTLFKAYLIIFSIILVSMILSQKSLGFISLLTSISFIIMTGTYLTIYKFKETNPYIPAAIFIFFTYLPIWLIIEIDPSLNKFLFVFGALMIPSLYQDKIITLINSGLGIATVLFAFYVHGDAVFGGYDIVPTKSLYFTLAVILIITTLMYIQSIASEKLRNSNIEKENIILNEKKQTESMLEKTKEQSDNLLNFNKRLEINTSDTNSLTQNVVQSGKEMQNSFVEQSKHIHNIVSDMSSIQNEANNLAAKSSDIMSKTDTTKSLIKLSEIEIDNLLKTFSNLKEEFIINLKNSKELYDKASDIKSLSASIQSISDKTHYLAVNASIEATRAGEFGKGFLVVADEIGKLANSSSSTTKQITELSSAIQEKSYINQNFINSTSAEIDASEAATHVFYNTFKEIQQVNDTISGFGDQIKTLSILIEKINTHIKETENISQKNENELNELFANTLKINENIENIANDFKTINKKDI